MVTSSEPLHCYLCLNQTSFFSLYLSHFWTPPTWQTADNARKILLTHWFNVEYPWALEKCYLVPNSLYSTRSCQCHHKCLMFFDEREQQCWIHLPDQPSLKEQEILLLQHSFLCSGFFFLSKNHPQCEWCECGEVLILHYPSVHFL